MSRIELCESYSHLICDNNAHFDLISKRELGDKVIIFNNLKPMNSTEEIYRERLRERGLQWKNDDDHNDVVPTQSLTNCVYASRADRPDKTSLTPYGVLTRLDRIIVDSIKYLISRAS